MSARVPVLVAGVLTVSGLALALVPSRVRMRAELWKRWRTWALAAPLYVGALWLGAPGAIALATGLGLVAVLEYGRMAFPCPRPTSPEGPTAPRAPFPTDLLPLVAASLALPLLAHLSPTTLDLRTAALLLVAAALPAILTGDARHGFTRTARTAFGMLWIPLPLTGLVLLGQDTALAVGLAVALGDVGAWCGGTALGRHGPLARRLSPISPNKTWAGVAGCAAATAAALAAVGAFTPALWAAVLLGCLLGDLLESMVKRESGVKDAGSWLPGFGGLLDRIDSLLLALLLAMVVTL
ncbi:phosphatidate cytidylyltransferase [Streptomyces sp. NBC_00237]|uniref:phosphatidate cytidylyltransferase n=1 Tax=Streptomyces sp. NBC_00237 TaxID=2975687 RepID=UPI00224E0E01|nr:phosphatidate cytidylyltransferase [Streptomyces sp. NBC_00237]MCX5204009.1 phosphatidate cytidylyltransferase [Streptomyces sp. NBC_00237]